MLEKLKDLVMREEEHVPERLAKIQFNSELKMDNPLAKEIRLYQNGRKVDVMDYSDVLLEELAGAGFEIEDHTGMEDIPIIDQWDGGTMVVEEI